MISNKLDIETTLQDSPKHQDIDINVWGLSLISIVPFAIKEKLKIPTFFNKKLKKHAQQSRHNLSTPGVTYATVRFRPYVSKVPWHTGPRAFLSQLFPRYGHYCGPNWSSGKDGGSLLWDKRPIDWLDYCCYCHDMGYDSHDQSELLKADLAFLECLERPHMATRGDVHVANLYKTMCISGLRSILIPYRQHLVKLKSGELSLGFGWLSNMKWKGWNAHKEAR
ncbi:hypothetical protein L2E82_36454 [Cichorium intybus]|uniref:Uncharacterized protein n=1 Tax=Cichorium intybus TaxID=13427 RepID=A0ACB9BRL3_CICIN|nr:hypothetical protein L2E82_36454 [Cichorium intybus]